VHVFSSRVPGELLPNRIATARAASPPRFDLTVSNPTGCGIAYPPDLLAPLADPAGLAYRPHPRGLGVARTAVAREYRRHGVEVDPERVLLTASTSEAYAFLFKLLAEPGEAVLVPTPSYPLFEHLANVEGVVAVPYRLDPEAGWRLELSALARAPENARAVVVVHPNNPTGSFVHPEDAAAVAALAADRGWAVIADEVFLDYPLSGGGGASMSFAARSDVLTFTLGGLSKSVGLPQLKLAWIVTGGPEPAVTAALDHLEFIADTFLSVATPVQLALPDLLEKGSVVREAVLARCRGNLAALQGALAGLPAVSAAPPEAGWSVVLSFPAVVGEEELALELLGEDGVAVHPGYFFELPGEGTLVLSLLPEPAIFGEGVRRLLRRLAARLGST
jgi:alanine-synthesizing transaminase